MRCESGTDLLSRMSIAIAITPCTTPHQPSPNPKPQPSPNPSNSSPLPRALSEVQVLAYLLALWLIMESDLYPLSDANVIFKYADDTNLLVPENTDCTLVGGVAQS